MDLYLLGMRARGLVWCRWCEHFVEYPVKNPMVGLLTALDHAAFLARKAWRNQ